MANLNPGPAVTGSANSVATLTPVNSNTDSDPQETGQIRCLAYQKGVNINQSGDVAVLTVINSNRWAVTQVLATNMTAPAAATTAAIGVYTIAAKAGYTVATPFILGGFLSPTPNSNVSIATAANTSIAYTGKNLYVNCLTTAGTACTIDVYVMGYDLSS